MALPDTKRPGDRILAADFNALTQAAGMLPALMAGSGVSISRGAQGVVISAGGGLSPVILEGIVEEVHGQDGDLVEAVKYTVRPRGQENDEALIEQRLPIYNRPFAATKLKRTARVGELCFIVRLPDETGTQFSDDLWMLTEQIDTFLCGSPGGRPLPPDPLKKKPRELAGVTDSGPASTTTDVGTSS
jgi:hypothetical protein